MSTPNDDERRQIDAFLREWPHVTLATASVSGVPEAALIGVAVTDEGDLVFDTLESTRKWKNLVANPSVALVIGWDDFRTIQLEGLATVLAPTDPDRDSLVAQYLARFPTGEERLSWPGIQHVRIRPTWLRYSDYRSGTPRIIELTGTLGVGIGTSTRAVP